MPIINEEGWKKAVESNHDSYGKACVDVARRVMELMDEDPTPFHAGYSPDVHTTHGIICKADKDIKAGGITGFMAGCVASMVTQCHSRGEEFRKQWNKDNGIEEKDDKGGVVNPAILTVE
jgi:hypothetical protein